MPRTTPVRRLTKMTSVWPTPRRMASGARRPDDLGGLRGGAIKAGSYAGRFDGFPCGAGIGVEDLPGLFRQQQVLGGRQCSG
jgi:hypothetical protein